MSRRIRFFCSTLSHGRTFCMQRAPASRTFNPLLHKVLVCCLLAAAILGGAHPLAAQVFRNPRRLPTATTPVAVLVGDLNNDGRPDLVYLTGNTLSGVLHPMLSHADDTYSETASIPLPNNSPRCLLVDLNGDGVLDIVCGTNGSQNESIAVFLGRGDGTFGAPLTSATPVMQSYSQAVYLPVAAADLNHDGKTDIVLFANGSAQVLTMLGDGTGHFTPGPAIAAGNDAVTAALVDLDGDGNLDLYLSGFGGSVLLGRGDGSFTYLEHTLDGLLRDVDGDGRLDLIGNGPNGLTAYRGTGNGHFDATNPLFQQAFPADASTTNSVANFAGILAYQDVNGDGVPDVVASSGDGMSVLLAQSPLHFQVASHVPIGQDLLDGAYFTSVVVADMNRDGHADVVAAGPQGVYLTYGRADGTFASADVYTSGANVTGGTLADFNGDGVLDVVTTGDVQLNLSLGRKDGSFSPSQPIANSSLFPSDYQRPLQGQIVHGDFNGDGFQDILVTGSTDFYGQQPYLFFGKGDGTFASPIKAPAFASGIAQAGVGDFDGDGRDDFAVANAPAFGDSTINVYLSQGDGTFTKRSNVSSIAGFRFADMDGDGKLDLLASSGSTITIRLGNGDGTFAAPTATLTLLTSAASSDIVVGDFDGDGKRDVAVLTSTVIDPLFQVVSQAITRFYGGTYPVFSAPVTTPITLPYTGRLLAADLNGDGIDDLFYDSGNSLYNGGGGPGITFITGKADRTVSAETTVVAGNTLLFLTAADLNGDGRLDLIAGNGDYNRHANSFTVLLNDGNTPQVTGTLTATPEPSRVQTAFQLTATLRPPAAYSTVALPGSVTFAIDGTTIGTAPLTANTATITAPSTLSRGIHTLTATWPGQPATGIIPAFPPLVLTGTHTVLGQPSTTTLTASATTVPANTPVTFTATTTEQGGTPPDLSKLQILDGTTPLTPTTTTSANTITIAATLTPGTHTLTAVFAGDTVAEPSTSAPLTITVAPYPGTLTLSGLGGFAFNNDILVATAYFNPAPSTSPGGTVVFSSGTQALGSSALDPATGTASINFNTAAGTYPIHAVYTPAFAGFGIATADGIAVIAKAHVALAYTVPLLPAPTTVSKPITLAASFDDGTGRHLATGSIVPSVDGVPQAPLPLPATAAFAYTVTGLLPGTHSVTLTYPGDNNFLPSTTVPAIITVLNRDFLFSGDQALTIPAQHYRSLTVQLNSIGDFAGTVALACSNLPPTASCRFSQSAVTLTAGSASAFLLTVDTSALPGYLAANSPHPARGGLAATLAGVLAAPLALVFLRRRTDGGKPNLFLLVVLVLTGAAAADALTGCSGQYPAYVAPGTYTFQVIGQASDSGTILTHSRPITFTVTP